MADQKPLYLASSGIRTQFQTGDTLGVVHGGTGATTAGGARTNLGLVIGTNVQAWDADLDAIAALSATGLAVRTAAGTWAVRTLTAPASGITVGNGDGVSGNPTLALANDLAALEGLAGTGIAVRTTADTWAQRSVAGTASNITVTNGDGVAGNPTIDLATVTQGSSGTSLVKIGLDTKGRVINNAAVAAADLQTLLDTVYLQLSGGSLTNFLTLHADPTSALHAATKQYVDGVAQGLDIKTTATVATTAALPAGTYNNGTAGVGATFTVTATGTLTVDGYVTALGDYILAKDQGSQFQNGLYLVTTAGAIGVSAVLTRATDMDKNTEFSGAFIPVGNVGTANANTLWLANPSGPVTVGTTNIPFTQLNGATSLTAGNGIGISGNTVSVTSANVGRIAVSGSGVDLASLTIGGSGVGTWTKFTVDTYGRVTSTASATAADVGAQASNAELDAIVALSTTGLAVRTGTGTWTTRTLTAPAAGITVSNGNGVSGNPTLALANDLSALEGLAGTGFAVRTAADTWAQRSIAGTAGRITVSNGDGVSGNPTIDLVGSIVTPGTYTSVTVDTYGRVTSGSAGGSSSSSASSLTNAQGSTINIGQAVYSNASGTVALARSDAIGTTYVVGLVGDTTIANGAAGNVVTTGVLTATTGQWDAVTGQSGGLTTNSMYWLSGGTAGSIVATAPTSGHLAPVGLAISTTQLRILPCEITKL